RGFTGSCGFAASAASGFTGSAASGFTGSAASGFTGSAAPGFTGSASSGFAASASSELAAEGSTPTGPGAHSGLGATAGFASPAGPGSPGISPADPTPPDFAPPVDPASATTLKPPAAADGNTPPWAPLASEPHTPAKDVASAAIPDSAFPAPAAPPADAAGNRTETASGDPSQNRMGVLRSPATPHRPAPPPRPAPARPAHVPGRPPGDPAPRPDSELPGAQAPAPPRGGAESLPKREQVRPEPPAWDALAEDVWPGGPRSAALHPPV